jgi:hypothetical protein
MSVNDGFDAGRVTQADWVVLREQFEELRAENAQLRAAARRARSHAVEERIRSKEDRLRRTPLARATHVWYARSGDRRSRAGAPSQRA